MSWRVIKTDPIDFRAFDPTLMSWVGQAVQPPTVGLENVQPWHPYPSADKESIWDKWIRIILLLCILAAVTGCFHGPSPYMPSDWPRAPADDKVLAGHTESSRLQIIIAYGPWWPNHAALRLEVPGRPALFWDPAGGYGNGEPGVRRINDVIIDGAPDMAAYLPFRWSVGDALVEIFEFAINHDEAERMYRILLSGAEIQPDSRIKFYTSTMGFFCASAISKFLYRFGAPSITTKSTSIWPKKLSQELYQQGPEQVLLLYRNKPPKIIAMTQPPAKFPDERFALDNRTDASKILH